MLLLAGMALVLLAVPYACASTATAVGAGFTRLRHSCSSAISLERRPSVSNGSLQVAKIELYQDLPRLYMLVIVNRYGRNLT